MRHDITKHSKGPIKEAVQTIKLAIITKDELRAKSHRQFLPEDMQAAMNAFQMKKQEGVSQLSV